MSKILIVSPIFPPDIGGPASYVPQLAKHLISRKNLVEVVCFCNSRPKKYSFSVIHVLPQGNSFIRQTKLGIMVLTKIFKSDIIYIQGTVTVGFVSLLIAKLFRKKTILKFVGDEFWEASCANKQTSLNLENFYKTNPNSNLLQLHRFVLKNADHIITPSVYLKKFLIQTHSIKPNKINVIPNPVVIPDQLPKISHNPGFVYAGRLLPWKKLDLVIKAVVRAHLINSKIKLTIIGEGKSKLELVSLVDTYNAKKYIKFTGSLDKKKTLSYIKASKGFVLMSDYEGQSHVLIEALLLGKRIIASNIEPNKELLGSTADLIFQDIDSLTQALIDSKSNKSHKNLKALKETHSWGNHINRLNFVFGSICEI